MRLQPAGYRAAEPSFREAAARWAAAEIVEATGRTEPSAMAMPQASG